MLLIEKSIAMKKIIFLQLLVAAALSAFAQKNKAQEPPPSWGQYKKLTVLSAAPTNGMEAFDTLRFILAPGETKVSGIERTTGGPYLSKKNLESKCDPAACQPGELIGNGRKREPHYLCKEEKFTIADPPVNSSEQTKAELYFLLQLQARRSPEDERASAYYAGVYYKPGLKPEDKEYIRFQRNLFHIGRSIGAWFNADGLPLTAKLVAHVWEDASYYIWKYKNYFLRIRPYKLEAKLNNLEETNWAAYPSGHATNSYVNAYLFSALIPEFESFFVKDAYDMAHSREIIGVHYPSDSESGRLLAWQLVQRLFSVKEFKEEFDAAKKEIETIRKISGF